jgi:hypothetical protein
MGVDLTRAWIAVDHGSAGIKSDRTKTVLVHG